MRRILVLVFSLWPVAAYAAVEPQSWTVCQTAQDCVVVGSLCPNFYWAINRQFVFANAARNAEQAGALDCSISFQSRPKAAQCIVGQCVIPPNQVAQQQIKPRRLTE